LETWEFMDLGFKGRRGRQRGNFEEAKQLQTSVHWARRRTERRRWNW
jgi:hypothetical protein